MPGLDELIRSYKAASEMEKTYSEEKKAIQGRICAKLGDNEVGLGDSFGCSWKSQSKATVSAKKLKAKYPAIYNELAEVSEYRVFRTRSL